MLNYQRVYDSRIVFFRICIDSHICIRMYLDVFSGISTRIRTINNYRSSVSVFHGDVITITIIKGSWECQNFRVTDDFYYDEGWWIM